MGPDGSDGPGIKRTQDTRRGFQGHQGASRSTQQTGGGRYTEAEEGPVKLMAPS